jgi:hypothetical protein
VTDKRAKNDNNLAASVSCGQIVAQPLHPLGSQTELRRLPVRDAVQKNKASDPPAKTSGQRRRETAPKEFETASRLIVVSRHRFTRKLAQRDGLFHQVMLIGFCVIGIVSG